MSIFGTNQVEEVILGNAVASEGTVSTFKATASVKEIKALAADGGAAAEGKLFYLLQKTSGDAIKGLDYEFSDKINPKKIERIVLKEYAAEVQKEVTVTGFAAALQANTTYSVQIRLYNEGGSLSTENFRIISGYYNTPASLTGITGDTVRDGIVAGLNVELESRGNNEFVIDGATADTIKVTGKFQEGNPDKGLGRPIEFDVTTKVLDEASGQNLGLLTAVTTVAGYPGNGTAKQVVAKEWFAKGFKYSPYRGMDYPAGFDTQYQANKSGIYNAVFITYKTSRISPTVEEQPRVLLIYVEKPTNNAAGNAPTNALLADLRVFVGANADVPADLAVL